MITVVLDIAIVAGFAIGGRRNHDVLFDLADIFQTAWPFLVALLLGWSAALLAAKVQQRSYSSALRRIIPSGLVIWIFTWLMGLLLRVAAGDTAEGQFPLVTGAFLAAGFIGWRLVALLLRIPRRRLVSGGKY